MEKIFFFVIFLNIFGTLWKFLESFGTILGVFWDIFGTFLEFFGTIWGTFWEVLGTFLGQFGEDFWKIRPKVFSPIEKYFGTRNIF